jgi:hypothetical protein
LFLRDFLHELITGDSTGLDAADDADRVEQLGLLESLKAATAAEQMRVTVDFAASQEQSQRDAGVREAKVGLGIGSQVGLATRQSPNRGGRFLGLAKVLTTECPATYTELREGRTTEWRAQVVVKETVFLTREDRLAVDAEVAPLLAGWGDADVEREVRQRAYRLDARGSVERAATAAKDRKVTVRPKPDVMSNLTVHLPVAQGVACYAALRTDAQSKRAQGDGRTLDQIMADTLVERVTGQTTAEAIPLAVGLVMTDRTLFNLRDTSDTGDGADRAGRTSGADEPAHLEGWGPIPADLARALVLAADAAADVWVQRLYTHPTSGQIAAIDSTIRVFRGALRKVIVARDRFCRTPWCGAPIRHVDHVTEATDGGPTSGLNGDGLCERCNYAKNAPGWAAVAHDANGVHTITTRTPTGQLHQSRPPDPPGTAPPRATPPDTTRTPSYQIDWIWPHVA